MPRPRKTPEGSERKGCGLIQTLIDSRDFHLVGRTTRNISDYTGVPVEDVEAVLTANSSPVQYNGGAAPMYRSPWTKLWGFANGVDGARCGVEFDRPAPKGKKGKETPPPMARKADDDSIDGMLDHL